LLVSILLGSLFISSIGKTKLRDFIDFLLEGAAGYLNPSLSVGVRLDVFLVLIVAYGISMENIFLFFAILFWAGRLTDRSCDGLRVLLRVDLLY
jgi:hypothetical protein